MEESIRPRRMASNAARNFYSRVERQLGVLEADGKEILQRLSALEGAALQPPDSMNQLLQRVATLETKVAATEEEQKTSGDRAWEVIKPVLLAVLGAVLALVIKSQTSL